MEVLQYGWLFDVLRYAFISSLVILPVVVGAIWKMRKTLEQQQARIYY